ncbi:MAG: hypothetical protein AAF655_12205 [Bacteroidota bacterium]
MKLLKLFFCFNLCLAAFGQQVADRELMIAVEAPTYPLTKGPVVGIDHGHHNFHTLEERFSAFGKLISADGYQAVSIQVFSKEELAKIKVLVIANPIHADNEEGWKRPIYSAFTEEEIKRVISWVREGGSLLLIADHMPFGGAASKLAEPFGVQYEDGFVMKDERTWPPETYSKAKGTLKKSPVTVGIDSLVAFTGSALKLPHDAIPIATYQEDQKFHYPAVEAWEFDEETTVTSTEEMAFGGLVEYGKGRAAFFTEAAMFTAQISKGSRKMGFNHPHATQNQQFILNVMSWLTE